MEKHYINANDLLLDSFKLAKKIHEQGFEPDFIIGIWRGGAPIGIAVQEYFDFIGIKTEHIAIRTSYYKGINEQQEEVKVYGLNHAIGMMTKDMNVLIVDDVFDSGKSSLAVVDKIRAKAGDKAPLSIKIACPWFKPERNKTHITPDFFIHTTDTWLVFPHELKELSLQEIRDNKGIEIAEILSPQ